METYNVKIKDYKEQTVVTLYAQSVMEREKLGNIIIQLKRYRTSISELILDNGDGMGYYACDYQFLDAEIRMMLFDEDLEQFYDYVSSRVQYIYLTYIRTDEEKEVQIPVNRHAVSDYNCMLNSGRTACLSA